MGVSPMELLKLPMILKGNASAFTKVPSTLKTLITFLKGTCLEIKQGMINSSPPPLDAPPLLLTDESGAADDDKPVEIASPTKEAPVEVVTPAKEPTADAASPDPWLATRDVEANLAAAAAKADSPAEGSPAAGSPAKAEEAPEAAKEAEAAVADTAAALEPKLAAASDEAGSGVETLEVGRRARAAARSLRALARFVPGHARTAERNPARPLPLHHCRRPRLGSSPPSVRAPLVRRRPSSLGSTWPSCCLPSATPRSGPSPICACAPKTTTRRCPSRSAHAASSSRRSPRAPIASEREPAKAGAV